jgi:hypothetical protein
MEVVVFDAMLGGQPGMVIVHARDSDGPDGISLLKPDALEIELSAGPMDTLQFEESQRLSCGMHDCIGALKLLAVDAYGNTATCTPFEVGAQLRTCCLQFAQSGCANDPVHALLKLSMVLFKDSSGQQSEGFWPCWSHVT